MCCVGRASSRTSSTDFWWRWYQPRWRSASGTRPACSISLCGGESVRFAGGSTHARMLSSSYALKQTCPCLLCIPLSRGQGRRHFHGFRQEAAPQRRLRHFSRRAAGTPPARRRAEPARSSARRGGRSARAGAPTGCQSRPGYPPSAALRP